MQTAGSWQLTQIHLVHHKLATGAVEGARAVALEAIPLTPILAPDLLELTVVPREPQGAVAGALHPRAAIVTGAWAAQEKRKFSIGLALGNTEISQRREKREQVSRRSNLEWWST